MRESARGLFELRRTHVVCRRVDEIARQAHAFDDAGEVLAIDVAGQFEEQLFRALFAPRQVQDLLGISERELADGSAGWSNGEASEARPLVDRFITWEFGRYLQSQLLKDADVMGMAHGVEIRVPYLDHRLVEYVLGLPASFKLARRMPKPLLIAALGEDLPRENWDRPKMGFTFPFEPWMRERADELQALSLDQTLLQPRAVKAVWDAFRVRRLHWSRPWALVVLARFGADRATRTAPAAAS